jgi:hypothetical protein
MYKGKAQNFLKQLKKKNYISNLLLLYECSWALHLQVGLLYQLLLMIMMINLMHQF